MGEEYDSLQSSVFGLKICHLTELSISCSFRDLFVLLITFDDGIVVGGLVNGGA